MVARMAASYTCVDSAAACPQILTIDGGLLGGLKEI